MTKDQEKIKESILEYKSALDFILKKLIDIKFSNITFKQVEEDFDDGERRINLMNETIEKFKIKEWVFDNLLKQLISDGYVNDFKTPKITHSGVRFILGTGYKYQKLKEKTSIWFKIISSIVIVSGTILGVIISFLQYDINKFHHIEERQEKNLKDTIELNRKQIHTLMLKLDSVKKHQ